MSVDERPEPGGGAAGAGWGAPGPPAPTSAPVAAVAGADGRRSAVGGGAAPPVPSRVGGSRAPLPGAAPGAGPAIPLAGPASAPPATPTALERDPGGVELAGMGERAGVFRRAARSTNTLAAYRSDWARFAAWCNRHGVSPLPATPATVAAYLAEAANTTARAGRSVPWRYSPATLTRWVATINKAHDLARLAPPGRDPEVRDTLTGIRRSRATPPARKTPLLLADLEHLVAAVPATGWPAAPGGLRNRCLLVMGWVGAFRRSELANLTVDDVTLHADDGLHVLVRQSKTDPEAHGRTYALP